MNEDTISLRERLAFSLNGFPDLTSYQFFSAYIFTFYFTVIGIPTFQMWLAYVIWGAWNAFNDPVLGYISDRKQHGRFGKRKFFIIVSFIPLCLMMIFLYTVPSFLEFYYFLFIILLFEFIYTLFDVNVKSLFPEMWITEEERAKTNVFLRILTIVAILCAFIIPGFLLPSIGAGATQGERLQAQNSYIFTGFIMAVIIFIPGLIFILLGIKEKRNSKTESHIKPSFIESFKMALKNKNFLVLVLANMATWFILNMLTAMYPLYCAYVLGNDKFLYYGISITFAFIVAAIFMPFHRKIGLKYGMRKGFMLTMVVLGFTFIPFLFFSDNGVSQALAMISAASIGFGLSGILFYFDILMGKVIDQDSLKSGVKRSASFYGTNAFIHRFSIILFISSVYLVFQYTAWQSEYNPTGTLGVVIGLKLLISVFPIIAAILAFGLISLYNPHGEKSEQVESRTDVE